MARHLKKSRIGIETVLMSSAMTGIGNYSFQLIKELICTFPDLEYLGFGYTRWSPFDETAVTQIDEQEYRVDIDHGKRITASLALRLQRLQLARKVYRTLHQFSFERTVERQALDLFHALRFLPPADPGVVTLPVVYDLSFVRFPETHPRERLKWLDRLPAVVARAPLVQTISEFSRNEIVATYGYPKEQIFVAPPAPSRIFRPLGIDATTPGLTTLSLKFGGYLLAVGTLEPRKNLKSLISAYGRLSRAERNRAPLAIVGSQGWGDLRLPRQASILIQEGNLRFLGRLPNLILRDLYEGAAALCFPSLYEGFGMPVVEAMSCGTSVIHGQGTSMEEISAGLGVYLPPMDIDAWTNAIRNAIAQNHQTSLDARNRRIARARSFQWSHSASTVRAAYAKLLH